MKKSDDVAETADEKSGEQMSRRIWIQSVACAAAGVSAIVLSPNVEAQGQAPPLAPAIRAMTAVTGDQIEENWIGPPASLVGIILDYSKGLPELNMAEIEPATDFLVR